MNFALVINFYGVNFGHIQNKRDATDKFISLSELVKNIQMLL
ncbi:hypothetical protein GXM_00488 [Nostoc sphaeroides CCNUC1]|uniref:Uncharacterized protein n=1 Tax=Nostoc sphaeroides CCNUC1 TaxID=2653204 RepID=A0A5P8VRH5_9NOSO|nr:hypothetical protein GXM_00488 [Nostoc sphaeroides CCNUC1]